jgi:hypothetical protein
MKEDELNQWKKSLCDQLQLLVEDSNRCDIIFSSIAFIPDLTKNNFDY